MTLLRSNCYALERRMIANSLDGMELLVELLREWQAKGGGRLTIAMEEVSAFGEALETYLSQAGFPVLVVSPLKVARFREILGADVNDLADAEAVARLLIAQPDLAQAPLREVANVSGVGPQRRLRQLSRRHARWTREQTAACNELHAVLRMAWLADYQSFFCQVHGASALAFWKTYPTPAEAAAATVEQIAALLREASRGRLNASMAAERAQKIHRIARLMVAAFGRKDPQRWLAWAHDIRLLAQHLTHLRDQLQQLDRAMDQLLEEIQTPLTSFKAWASSLPLRFMERPWRSSASRQPTITPI